MKRDLRLWRPASIAIVIAAGYALTLRIFYPGVMTFDARYVHADSLRGFFGDWQSPLQTLLWAAIDPIAPGAASMFLLMATLYWLGFAVLSFAVVRRSYGAALAMSLVAFTPPAFVFVGMIWRDVLFASIWILAAGLAFVAAGQQGRVRYAMQVPIQVLAMGLLAFGLLLRINALFAAPILAAYVIWPTRFELRRTALLYVPAVVAFYALIPAVYYGMLNAKRQNALHTVFVFDLGGITHFTKQNQFPVGWSADQERQLIESCYQPAAWDYYWTMGCPFVMARLEDDKLFGSPTLAAAWRQAVLSHPAAYLQHRLAVMGQFLLGNNPTIWTVDIEHPDRVVFADNAWFVALKGVSDVLKPTPLFRAVTWLVLCTALSALAWLRRDTPVGAFVMGVSGSAVVYVATYLPFGVAADFRYAYFAVLAGLTSAVLLAARALSIPRDSQRLAQS
jgi:hypothetical protein